MLDRLRSAVKKVQIFNKRNQLQVYKLFELINFIKQEKRKVASQNQG